MARKARENLETSFFHVMVQGINKEYIFKKERYIRQYINLLRNNIYNVQLKIISFCIMSNHAHLLIRTESIEDLSTYMQKVNSSYAKYYNYMEDGRVGYVFRDRFKSEPILERRRLIRCVKYIHNNPVKAGMVKNIIDYKYSSYKYYSEHILNHGIFTKDEMQYICDDNTGIEGDFIDIDIKMEDRIKNGILEFLEKENIKTFEIFEKRDILKKLIKYLKFDKKINYIEIKKYLEISRWTMDGLKQTCFFPPSPKTGKEVKQWKKS